VRLWVEQKKRPANISSKIEDIVQVGPMQYFSQVESSRVDEIIKSGMVQCKRRNKVSSSQDQSSTAQRQLVVESREWRETKIDQGWGKFVIGGSDTGPQFDGQDPPNIANERGRVLQRYEI
jgi:hypothetical protein